MFNFSNINIQKEIPFILVAQQKLFQKLSPSICVDFVSEKEKMFLVASNITEDNMKNLELVTNSPSYTSYMNLVGLEVVLAPNHIPQTIPIHIYGLFDFVNSRISRSDADAFASDSKTHFPFINGFKNGITIGELIDNLTAMSRQLPNTYEVPKIFKLIFDPPTATAAPPKPTLLNKR
jgi:hypothetical protein